MLLHEPTTPQKAVKVTVNKPFRVIHPDTGEAHTEGHELSVPEDLANEWIRFGWVHRVHSATTKEK